MMNYFNSGEELAKRLVAYGSPILQIENVFDILRIPEVKTDDLDLTLASASAALGKAKSILRKEHDNPTS